MLDLLPFPALVMDPRSSAVVLSNEAAREVALGPRADSLDPATHYAEHGGVRITPRDLARELTAIAAGRGGAEFIWHAPGRQSSFRAYCRALPPSVGRAPLALLTLLDTTEQGATEGELRRALEVRDEFFSIASHELKDPLFSLKLSNQLLRHTAMRQGEIPAHILHHLEVEQRQIERLSRLVDNLLDVSRILNHRHQLDIETLDLAELVRDVVARFREQGAAAGTPVEAEVPGPVIGDFDRLKVEQILGNLLSNALKYGGGRPVYARLRAGDDEAAIEVEDQGPGIAAEDQARIFGRFERASGGHRKESLGLGLYIARSLAEAHGGSVSLRSEPGRGTTFTVTLPIKRLPTRIGAPAGDEPCSTHGA